MLDSAKHSKAAWLSRIRTMKLKFLHMFGAPCASLCRIKRRAGKGLTRLPSHRFCFLGDTRLLLPPPTPPHLRLTDPLVCETFRKGGRNFQPEEMQALNEALRYSPVLITQICYFLLLSDWGARCSKAGLSDTRDSRDGTFL